MSDMGAALKQLHDVHTAMHRVKTELERGPRLVRAKRKMVADKEAEIEQYREKLTEARKSADGKQLQLRTNEDKLTQFTGKLNQATNNREFDAIKSQMEADKMANSVLEDEILEMLEKVDALKDTIAETEKQRDDFVKEVESFEAEVKGKQGDLQAELDRIAGQVKEAEKIIPAKIMGDYQRVVQAHGATALAPLEGKACTACATMVTQQEAINLRTGKFLFCRSCGRLLYPTE
ncbi:zinc ribbon domain-containing protein [Calycomorphotria hydatis]|uniref:Zinc ribbon domain protein n=1 Tax=Calycomorphotria hydatis TaxID=2528027 RepID=A0A517T5Y0_9PLAN|nr:hypothetical protein [Calycomorphotria hydatis]QDT63768.1 Putative zinc ribbon domain protein [Calycomorphotria hydatis]